MASERIQRQIERLLDEAEQAVESGEWDVVRARTQTVLHLDPGNSDALTFSAAAERALGDSPTEPVAPSTTSHSAPKPPTAPATAPTSFANGRYQIKELLGEGGKKRVYQAHDSVLDRDVALAVIKTEGLDPTSRVRITREAQAMGRLGDHPHVLSIHDLGEDNGQPYMVLPLMPGGDVGTLLEKAEDHRLPFEQAIDFASQICRRRYDNPAASLGQTLRRGQSRHRVVASVGDLPAPTTALFQTHVANMPLPAIGWGTR